MVGEWIYWSVMREGVQRPLCTTKGQAVIVCFFYYPSALRPLYQMCHITVANEIRRTWSAHSRNEINKESEEMCLECGSPLGLLFYLYVQNLQQRNILMRAAKEAFVLKLATCCPVDWKPLPHISLFNEIWRVLVAPLRSHRWQARGQKEAWCLRFKEMPSNPTTPAHTCLMHAPIWWGWMRTCQHAQPCTQKTLQSGHSIIYRKKKHRFPLLNL